MLKELHHLYARVAILPEDLDGVSDLHRQLQPDFLEAAILPLRLGPLDLFLLRLQPPGERGVTGQVDPFLHREYGGERHLCCLPARFRLAANHRAAVGNLERLDTGHTWKIERVGNADAYLVPRTIG